MILKKVYLSVDIGGTNIKYGLLNRSGNLMVHTTIKTPQNITGFMQCIEKIVQENLEEIRGIAISVPGKVDTESGTIYYGGSLPFLDGLCLKQRLEDEFELPVAVENDGKSAALAELWLGSLKQVNNGAVLVLGTGVGGGIVLNHQLFRGSHFQAGELSFMSTSDRTRTLDDLLGWSGSAVKMIEHCAAVLDLEDLHDGLGVFEHINNHDERVFTIFNEYCDAVATMILNVQSVVDLQCFAISGGISSQSILVDTIQQSYSKIAESIPLIDQQFQTPQIVQAHFKSDANLYGALYNLLLSLDTESVSIG